MVPRKRSLSQDQLSSVSSKELLKSTTSNVSQALVGKLPGLISQQATGAPGADDVSLLVRGHSTYNGGDGPLILVDGVERSMAYINPNEVESVTILKDAASCAVYGMKAAAGVILDHYQTEEQRAKLPLIIKGRSLCHMLLHCPSL